MYTSQAAGTWEPLATVPRTCRDGRDLVRAAARAYAGAITDERGVEEFRRLERVLLEAVEACRRRGCARCVRSTQERLLESQ